MHLDQPMMSPQCMHILSVLLTHSFRPLAPVRITLASLPTCQEQTLGGSCTTLSGMVVSLVETHAGLVDERNMLMG